MEPQSSEKPSTIAQLIAILAVVAVAFGIGYALLLATGNNALAIGMAGATSALGNNFVRNALWKGKS